MQPEPHSQKIRFAHFSHHDPATLSRDVTSVLRSCKGQLQSVERQTPPREAIPKPLFLFFCFFDEKRIP